MNKRHELLRAELNQQTVLLARAGRVLARSLDAFQGVGVRSQYSDAELDVIDAFTSRFARATDLLTQRLFPLLDMVELLEPCGLLDRLNRAEKRGLILSATLFREIRLLRNDISHEYASEDFEALVKGVSSYAPAVLQAIAAVESYIAERYPASP